jgi:hypothetical protein
MTAHNPVLTYPKTTFTAEPTSYGYIYIGMRVDPPRRIPFVRRSVRRSNALRRCTTLARQLEELPEVIAVTVYEAVLIIPVKGSPRFDIMLLIQTTTPDAVAAVKANQAYQQLDADIAMTARNIRRIGDVDSPGSGTFLFNHFTAADPDRALRTWEDITSWFTHEAKVDDSALLQPTGESPYVLVNHVRLPCSPIRFVLHFAKPSFRTFVVNRLRANHIGNAPVICRLA